MTTTFHLHDLQIGTAPITVLGVDLHAPAAALPEPAQRALRRARLVAGGRWHLEVLGDLLHPDAQIRELGADVATVLAEVVAFPGAAAVLASGDPGFFGILRALAGVAGDRPLDVQPAVSSVARVCAAAGLPWDDALVVSAHGRDPRMALNVCRRHPKVVVLTAPGFGPGDLAAALPPRDLVVAERLGLPGMRVVRVPAGTAPPPAADPNVVLVVDPAAAVRSAKRTTWPARQTPTSWALPESAFAHNAGMITKAEVRALALAWLGPGVGDLVWDVGAGSGAVAIECSRLGAAVIAVERDQQQRNRIRANCAAHDAPVQVVAGAAPDVLAGLPDPDAVFVGGGGDEVGAILGSVVRRAPRVVVVALAAVDRVAAARDRLAAAGMHVDGTLLHAARLTPLGNATRLAATNPVFLLRGRPAP